MKIKLKRLHKDAQTPLKKEGHDMDFCYDVKAVSCEKIADRVYRYKLGFAAEIDHEDFEKKYPFLKGMDYILDVDVRPRSSIWETGLVLSNSEGTIDDIYRGEFQTVFYHVLDNMPIYEVGDRIAQIKVGITFPVEFEWVDELSETIRGAGGYGHTGRK